MLSISVRANDDPTSQLRTFYKAHGTRYVIGVSGGADDKLLNVPDNESLQLQYAEFQKQRLTAILDDFMRPLRGTKIAILTGGTSWGVPRLALEAARRYGFKTIGVMPKVGERHALDDEHVDLRITVEPFIGEGAWGDEAAVWTSVVDGVLMIGGGAGTLAEAAHIMKRNEALIKTEQRPKFLVPIYGTGGVADSLYQLWARPAIRDKSMPRAQVHTGADAAHRLIEALGLYDGFDSQSSTSLILEQEV
jgi:predicted Rossmann-fold nucleotide-binding protein